MTHVLILVTATVISIMGGRENFTTSNNNFFSDLIVSDIFIRIGEKYFFYNTSS